MSIGEELALSELAVTFSVVYQWRELRSLDCAKRRLLAIDIPCSKLPFFRLLVDVLVCFRVVLASG